MIEKRLNIVIPMAGAGSRFAVAGYLLPKPLIDVAGRPMIEVVIKNIRPVRPHRFIFICQKAHLEQYALSRFLRALDPECVVLETEGVTEGAACTVLKARHLIDSTEPLMIANSDQYVDFNINHYLARLDENDWDGMLMTMWADDPKWSFVALDATQHVVRVVEKEVISRDATVGIYNFKMGSAFVQAADAMIARKQLVNGEYYVAPTYNVMIDAGAKIGVYNVGAVGKGMYGLGIPADLNSFLDLLSTADVVL